MKKSIIIPSVLLLAAPAAMANTVLLDENFNDGSNWQASFPTMIEGDHNNPAANIFPLFTDDSGTARPWWKGKDSSASADGFLMSHSIYSTPGTSNDWIQSGPLAVDSKGYMLSFGAQNVLLRSGNRMGDLHVFVTDSPLTETNLPDASQAALVVSQPPTGPSAGDVEGEFTTYTLSLDPWVGQTVYIAFANLNTDKDIVCIDDVKVERLDAVEVSAASDAEWAMGNLWSADGGFTVQGTVRATETVGAWTLTATVDGVETLRLDGSGLTAGESMAYDFDGTVVAGQTADWTVTLTTAGNAPVVRRGQVTGLAFRPYHRVLVEEATGLWCGNCPLGIYNMESLSEHPDTRDWAIPVSVHIPGSGIDYLVNDTYAGMLGLTYAPAYRVERDRVVRGFVPADDSKPFDPSRPNSLGALMSEHHRSLTLFDIDMEADWVVEGADTTAVKCRVTVTPACDWNTSNFRIGLAMKENNVHGGNSILMEQHNYLSGQNLETTVGGWTQQADKVRDVRFHDVARGVWDFNGIAGSMPAAVTASEPYTWEYTVQVPDTYFAAGSVVGNPAVKTDFVTMVAFLIDLDTQDCLNAVAVPMSEHAEERYDNFGYHAAVETIKAPVGKEAEAWYTLQGVRVERPAVNGVYLHVKDGKAEKRLCR